jgi:hypothetical protein
MAAIPKAAKSGGSSRKRGPAHEDSTAPTGRIAPKVAPPSGRGGHKIGPTRCTAKGSTRTY